MVGNVHQKEFLKSLKQEVILPNVLLLWLCYCELSLMRLNSYQIAYIVGLFDFGSGKLMGSIGVDYLKPTEITEENLEFFKKKSERLAGYLSTRNN